MRATNRYKPEVRREIILNAAVFLAEKQGYRQVIRDDIARLVGISGAAVQYHFKTMDLLRDALMEFAVKTRNAKVVAQGLALSDTRALAADDKLKQEALRTMI